MYKLAKVKILLILSLLASSYAFGMKNTNASYDPCSRVEGTWVGSSDIRFVMLSCSYNSTIDVFEENNPHRVVISSQKTSGSFLCPKTIVQKSSGSCVDGRLVVYDDKIDLVGDLSDDGRSAILSGYIKVLFKHVPLNIAITKVGY